MTPRVFYRAVALAEAVTWTLLIAAMLLKYVFDAGSLPVTIAGSIHGVVFITYLMTSVLVGVNQFWAKRTLVLAAATTFIPYATIPFDRHLERNDMLDGEWRSTATDDPRDHTLDSRLLRWLLRRPAVLVPGFMAAVAIIVGTLLVVGPPGGRS
ncbi:DUF3817 domain-containing protein [Specibacter cremeus]|uniref:DUF3817 domain-containing protein n=1 Tax=Specibacter cremeus TaxID=1629051 RepID=UPI000F7B0986|nr:DUF3817 domain-containing protein [Specibacter cremeus]